MEEDTTSLMSGLELAADFGLAYIHLKLLTLIRNHSEYSKGTGGIHQLMMMFFEI